MTEPTQAGPGWYPDHERQGLRYWDGVQWTEDRVPVTVPKKVGTGDMGWVAAGCLLGLLAIGGVGNAGTRAAEGFGALDLLALAVDLAIPAAFAFGAYRCFTHPRRRRIARAAPSNDLKSSVDRPGRKKLMRLSAWRTAALIALAVAVLYVGDQVEQGIEMKRLLSAVQVSERAMADYTKAAASSSAPVKSACSNAYSGDAACTAAAQQWFSDMQASSARSDAAVRIAADDVRRVHLLPWHSALRDARAAYLAHNHAWDQYLAAVSDDPKTVFEKSSGTSIEATFTIAHKRFQEAVPTLDMFGSRGPVEDIFRD